MLLKNRNFSAIDTNDHPETETGRRLHETIMRLMRGIRDSTEQRQAMEKMDRERDELRQRLGTLNVVVDLVRDTREYPREFMRDEDEASKSATKDESLPCHRVEQRLDNSSNPSDRTGNSLSKFG